MAKASILPPEEPTVVLELTVAEAQYVEDALYWSEPKHLDDDEPWNALHGALYDSGIGADRTASGGQGR